MERGMEKLLKKIVGKSYCIKKIEDGFSFRTRDDRPCELRLRADLEICENKPIFKGVYSLKISNFIYTSGTSQTNFGNEMFYLFAELWTILKFRYNEQIEKEKQSMFKFVESLND